MNSNGNKDNELPQVPAHAIPFPPKHHTFNSVLENVIKESANSMQARNSFQLAITGSPELTSNLVSTPSESVEKKSKQTHKDSFKPPFKIPTIVSSYSPKIPNDKFERFIEFCMETQFPF